MLPPARNLLDLSSQTQGVVQDLAQDRGDWIAIIHELSEGLQATTSYIEAARHVTLGAGDLSAKRAGVCKGWMLLQDPANCPSGAFIWEISGARIF